MDQETIIRQHRATPTASMLDSSLWLESGDITIFFRSAQDALALGEQLVKLAQQRIRVETIMREEETTP